MLHMFASQAEQESAPAAFRGLVVVGCCYNLLAADPVRTSERALTKNIYGTPSPKTDAMADEVVHYPLRQIENEDFAAAPDCTAAADGGLLIDRRLCAAAAESTNPAFVRQLSTRSDRSNASSKENASKAERIAGVASLRPRRLARALVQRRLRDQYPETYLRSTTLKLKTGQCAPVCRSLFVRVSTLALLVARVQLEAAPGS